MNIRTINHTSRLFIHLKNTCSGNKLNSPLLRNVFTLDKTKLLTAAATTTVAAATIGGSIYSSGRSYCAGTTEGEMKSVIPQIFQYTIDWSRRTTSLSCANLSVLPDQSPLRSVSCSVSVVFSRSVYPRSWCSVVLEASYGRMHFILYGTSRSSFDTRIARWM